MSCGNVRELILDALVESLDADQAAELRQHTSHCEACAAETEGYSELWRQLGVAIVDGPLPDALERFEAGVRRELAACPPGAGQTRRSFSRTAATIALLLGIGAVLGAGFVGWWQDLGRDSVTGDRYLLILSATTEPADQTQQFTSEMRAWVRSLQAQSVAESFHGVFPSTSDATPPGGPLLADDMLGVMIIRAVNAAEARRIALQSPSLNYGGQVEVRAVN